MWSTIYEQFPNTFELSFYFLFAQEFAAWMVGSELPLGSVLWMRIRIILDHHEKFSRSLKIIPNNMNNIRKRTHSVLISGFWLRTSEKAMKRVRKLSGRVTFVTLIVLTVNSFVLRKQFYSTASVVLLAWSAFWIRLGFRLKFSLEEENHQHIRYPAKHFGCSYRIQKIHQIHKNLMQLPALGFKAVSSGAKVLSENFSVSEVIRSSL